MGEIDLGGLIYDPGRLLNTIATDGRPKQPFVVGQLVCVPYAHSQEVVAIKAMLWITSHDPPYWRVETAADSHGTSFSGPANHFRATQE